ncbi:hypothetical protein L3Q67_25790 [Saccharothrix sp. AJ9571]|nr:hypothetical protein L3Q67_25790 [Saccharothrix sp. AJ9571]
MIFFQQRGDIAEMAQHPVHRTMILIDVASFGSPDRTLPHQVDTRAGLYTVVSESMAAAGVQGDVGHQEDRGDGLFVLVPPEIPKAPLVEVLPDALTRAVRRHNNTSHQAARMRLRLAVHAGEVAIDEHGATSTALTTAFRLLDAAPLKAALASSPGVVAMIVSAHFFDEVVRHSATVDPATFRPVEIAVKEFRNTAWIALPDYPYPPDRSIVDRLPQHNVSDSQAPDGTDTHGPATDGVGLRGVTILGGVHGAGSGVTIGAATGDHLIIGPPSLLAPTTAVPPDPR